MLQNAIVRKGMRQAALAVLLVGHSAQAALIVPVHQDSFPVTAREMGQDPAGMAATGHPPALDGAVHPGVTSAFPDFTGLKPAAADFVKAYALHNRGFLEALRDKQAATLRTIENILMAHGLPRELKYLAVIESKLGTRAVSPMGAAGPWQFMPVTARSLGLRVRPGADDRLDIRKSTEAAAYLLEQSYRQFGDWLLVIAAFNAGSGRMAAVLRDARVKDFWAVEARLPRETRQHVRKYIATHYCLEGRGGLTTGLAMAPTPAHPYEAGVSDSLDIQGAYHSLIVTGLLGFNLARFDILNPGFNDRVGTTGYRLRLPEAQMQAFLVARSRILETSERYLLDPGTFDMDRAASEIRLPPVRMQ
jgi:membrane-bound lytic murein transglycosylase D